MKRPSTIKLPGRGFAVRFAGPVGGLRTYRVSGTAEADRVSRLLGLLMDSSKYGEAPSGEVAAWVERLTEHWRAKLAASGLLDSVRVANEKGLGVHVDEWMESIRQDKPGRADDVDVIMRTTIGAGFSKLTDLSLAKVEAHAAKMVTAKAAPSTVRKHVGVIGQFVKWCCRTGRLRSNPLVGLRNVSGGAQRERRSLSHDE